MIDTPECGETEERGDEMDLSIQEIIKQRRQKEALPWTSDPDELEKEKAFYEENNEYNEEEENGRIP